MTGNMRIASSKPDSFGWVVYLLPVTSIICLIIYPIKAKEKGLWQWERR